MNNRYDIIERPSLARVGVWSKFPKALQLSVRAQAKAPTARGNSAAVGSERRGRDAPTALHAV